MASLWLGQLHTDMENYKSAIQYYKNGISIYEEFRLLPSWSNIASLSEASAKVLNHDHHINLSDQYKHCSNVKVKSLEGWKARIISEILINLDAQQIPDAEDWIKKAIEADKRNGMMWQLAKDYASYAELSKRKEDPSKAQEHLKKAIEIFKQCAADGWVEKYETELQRTLD